METESKNNSGDTSQITFKLTIGERQHIIETAEFFTHKSSLTVNTAFGNVPFYYRPSEFQNIL